MSYEHEDILRRSFTDAEMQKLFSGFSDTEAPKSREHALPSAWVIREQEFKSGNALSEYIIRHEKQFDVAFLLLIYKNASFLRWHADIPIELLPGQTAHEYLDGFESTVFDRLSARISPSGNESESKRKRVIKSHSTITAFFTDDTKQYYDLSTEAGDLQFKLDFCTNARPFEQLSIHSNTSPNSELFALHLVYPRTQFESGVMGLSMPMSFQAIRGWNEHTMDWVLSTHTKNKSRFTSTTPKNLANLIQERVSDHFQSELDKNPRPFRF